VEAFNQMLSEIERQNSEPARERAALGKFALEGAGDGIWDWNATTNETQYSHQWKAMLGYTMTMKFSSQAAEWEERIHPEDKAIVLEAVQKHRTA